ncbi:MAG: hypothetical protein ACJ75S_04000 [Solirubrobacterales bacterium]
MIGTATLCRILRGAREDRCLLREKWEAGTVLSGREQLRLARTLIEIRPASIERGGRRVPCEPRFDLRPKDRRRLVEALLEEGISDGEILAVVPKLTKRTFQRLKASATTRESPPANGLVERRFATFRGDPLGRPQMAYRDASSGANVEAEQCFLALVRGTA